MFKVNARLKMITTCWEMWKFLYLKTGVLLENKQLSQEKLKIASSAGQSKTKKKCSRKMKEKKRKTDVTLTRRLVVHEAIKLRSKKLSKRIRKKRYG